MRIRKKGSIEGEEKKYELEERNEKKISRRRIKEKWRLFGWG